MSTKLYFLKIFAHQQFRKIIQNFGSNEFDSMHFPKLSHTVPAAPETAKNARLFTKNKKKKSSAQYNRTKSNDRPHLETFGNRLRYKI